MFCFTIVNQLRDYINELAWEFNLGETNNSSALRFIKLWDEKRATIEDIKTIRGELFENRERSIGHPGTLESYVAEISERFIIPWSKFKNAIDAYLHHDDRGWLYQPIIPELQVEKHFLPEDETLLLFVRCASELEDALQRICAIAEKAIGVKLVTSDSKLISEVIALTTSIPGQPKKERKRRASTLALEKRLREYVDNYIKIEGKQPSEAMELAAEKESCSFDTVKRALGWRKR